MKYHDLKPSCDFLNRKFKGKKLPNTDWTVEYFIIMPNEQHDKTTHDTVIYAIDDLGMPVDEIEEALTDHPHLDIRIRLRDKHMHGFHFLHHLNTSVEQLAEYEVA